MGNQTHLREHNFVESAAPPRPLVRDGACILAIGNDAALLATRACVLQKTGYPVRMTTPAEAGALSTKDTFRLVVFGHTLSDQEVTDLLGQFRKASPRSKLLLTCYEPRSTALEGAFDASIQSREGPAALVQKANDLLRGETLPVSEGELLKGR